MKVIAGIDGGDLQRLVNDGYSHAQLAQTFGCSTSTIRRALRTYGVTSRHERPRKRRVLDDATWLAERLVDRRRKVVNVAAELRVGVATVRRAAHHHNIPLRRSSTPLTVDAERLRRDWELFGNVEAVARLNGIGWRRAATQLAALQVGPLAKPAGTRATTT